MKWIALYAALQSLLVVSLSLAQEHTDNVNGVFSVGRGFHYSNKTSLTWGQNGQASDFSVVVRLSHSCAVYNCTNTDSYSCEDTAGWPFDFNKLWGKARCGYLHDHHEDSDRFVFRRCSDSSCSSYTGTSSIQIAAYSYDNRVTPYSGEDPGLLKVFSSTILPDYYYKLRLDMDATGKSSFTLLSYDFLTKEEIPIEVQYVYHKTICADNYFEGTVQGLYFGGTCKAPTEVSVEYIAA